jgi:hypothetical protein
LIWYISNHLGGVVEALEWIWRSLLVFPDAIVKGPTVGCEFEMMNFKATTCSKGRLLLARWLGGFLTVVCSLAWIRQSRSGRLGLASSVACTYADAITLDAESLTVRKPELADGER